MTEQHESRWSLNSTGNRVLLAVVVGLLVSFCAGVAELHGAARVVVFVVAAGLTYALVTTLRR
jgi:hypothetical protein